MAVNTDAWVPYALGSVAQWLSGTARKWNRGSRDDALARVRKAIEELEHIERIIVESTR